MTLYINGRFLTQPMTGVNRYAYSICKALLALGHSFTLICPNKPFLADYDTTGFSHHFGDAWHRLATHGTQHAACQGVARQLR
jgi:hypothetical protein